MIGWANYFCLGPVWKPMAQWNDILAAGFASGYAPNMDGREEVPSGTPTKSSTTSLGSFVSMDEPSAFRGQNREPFCESRTREKRLSGSMSGKRNQSHVNRTEATLRKHGQQPPGDYSHCACSRLYSNPTNRDQNCNIAREIAM